MYSPPSLYPTALRYPSNSYSSPGSGKPRLSASSSRTGLKRWCFSAFFLIFFVVYFVSVGWVITSVGGDERNNDDETTKKAEVGHGRGEISEGDDFDNIGHHHHHHLHGNQIVDDEIGKYYSAEGRPEGRPDAKLDSPPDAGVTAGVPKAPKSQKPQRQAAKGSSDRPTESIYTDYYSQKGDIEVPTFFSPPGASLHDGEIKAFGRETPSSLGTGNAEEDTIFLMLVTETTCVQLQSSPRWSVLRTRLVSEWVS